MSSVLNKLTISESWRRSREEYRDLKFLGYANGAAVTYGDTDRHIRSIQKFLTDRGIRRGDKVALISESRPEWGQVYLAVTTMGAVAVPVMADFSSEQIANILDHSDSVYLFASEKVFSRIKDCRLAREKKLVVIREGLKTGETEYGGETAVFREDGNDLFTLHGEGESLPDMTASVEEDSPAAILYTSGTTGASKGVMLSHRNITHNASVGINVAHVKTGERFLSVLPLAHSYECTLGLILPMISGSEIRYIKGAPTARIMLPAMKKVRPHLMLTVPILIEKIYKFSILPKFTKGKVIRTLYAIKPVRKFLNRFVAGKKLKALFGGNLHFFGIGGAPLAPDVEQFLRDARFPYSVGYGLTETAPCLAGAAPEDSVYRAIGPAFEDVELRIADVNPETGHGEIQARGPNIMLGYYKAPEKTSEVFTEDGWFRTGDLGYLNEKATLFIKGRLKNMILGPNGENIYPEEIEAVINRDPFVLESLVTSKGNGLVARVQLNYEKLEEFVKELKESPEERARIKNEILESVRQKANGSLNALSRLSELVEQMEPFEKTPSLKIKRFLYT